MTRLGHTSFTESRFAAIFSQVPFPLAVLRGPEHIFDFANSKYMDLVGERDLFGRTIQETFPEFAHQGFYEILDQVYKTGVEFQAKDARVKLKKKSGELEETFQDFTYQPLRDMDGKIEGILVVAVDVTAQVKASLLMEASEISFNQLADSMPQIVWIAGPNGILNYTNQRWIDYSGSTIPAEWTLYVHPDDLESASQIWMHSIQSGENYETEFRLQKKDQSYRWHLVRALPVRDRSGAIVEWHGTCTDIEDQKRVQNALIETTNQLQHSENDLFVAKTIAETANQLKTSFLANMSHEIRTPLGAILGFTEILKHGGHDLNERQRYLDVISKNGKALTRIIDDILDLSKVEAGRLEIETLNFSLRALCDEVLSLFADTVKEKGIHLYAEYSATMPPVIRSDPMRLRQILINIIGNAVKFTKRGEIKVSLNADVDGENARVVIEVADTGMGLSAEQAERLFRPFSQADNSTTRKFGGTGLGLALSKRLAMALNGDVTLERYRPDEGCVFCIEIRAEIPATVSADAIHSESAPAKIVGKLNGVRVLVVDDSPDNLELLEIILQDEGMKVEVATNGADAIEKAMASAYDVILMDIQMPIIDGHEAVKTLRKRGYLLPIIALTAHAMKEERERTAASGFNDHVSKPIHIESLIKTILKLMGKA